jgi:hypothetical protein
MFKAHVDHKCHIIMLCSKFLVNHNFELWTVMFNPFKTRAFCCILCLWTLTLCWMCTVTVISKTLDYYNFLLLFFSTFIKIVQQSVIQNILKRILIGSFVHLRFLCPAYSMSVRSFINPTLLCEYNSREVIDLLTLVGWLGMMYSWS